MTGTIQEFNYDINILAAALWQHGNAPHILGLLNAKQTWYDENQTDFWSDFYTNIFNLETANDFGLAVWAIILGAPIAYVLTGGGTPAWGFGEYRENFDNGNFAPNNGTNTTYTLSTASARIVLQLRYYQLTGTCTVPAINRMLNSIFGAGVAYLVDTGEMTQQYVFLTTLPSDLQFALTTFDILPRPAGVGSDYIIYEEPPWGFNSDATNFNNGNFTDT